MKKYCLLVIALTICCISHATITVTKTTCNYQAEDAVIERNIQVGWQLSSDIQNDIQTAYQIEVKERITGKMIFESNKVMSSESQHIALPSLTENKFGYQWRVRVWDRSGNPSAWSAPQSIYVAPTTIDAQWIGAISKTDAKIPTGR